MDVIIEAPFNLGVEEHAPGIQPGVRFLPDAMRNQNLASRLGITEIVRLEAPDYVSTIDPETGVRNANEVAAYCKKLSLEINKQTAHGKHPLVIGGDCSILPGIMLGLKKHGKYGLFFMDGHTDFITINESSTKAVAGMDLAIAAGLGPDLLTNIDGEKPYIIEQNIYCYGNREYDAVYEAPVINSEVNYYHLNKIRQTGIDIITSSFLKMSEKLNGFWIHFDVDVLDDNIMPCVDSRTPGGLSYDELEQTLIPLLVDEKFAGMSITILDPTLDKDGIYTRAFADRVVKIIA